MKELEAVILPWWLLTVLLTGGSGGWHWVVTVGALYIVAVEAFYRHSFIVSRREGFARMVRMPLNPVLARLVLSRYITIPRGTKCYMLHVHGRPISPKAFIRELKADMQLARQEQAHVVYIGNTFYDLGEWAQRILGADRVRIIEGALFGRWLQAWKAPDERWRIVIIETGVIENGKT